MSLGLALIYSYYFLILSFILIHFNICISLVDISPHLFIIQSLFFPILLPIPLYTSLFYSILVHSVLALNSHLYLFIDKHNTQLYFSSQNYLLISVYIYLAILTGLNIFVKSKHTYLYILADMFVYTFSTTNLNSLFIMHSLSMTLFLFSISLLATTIIH